MIGTWILLVALVSAAFLLGWVARNSIPAAPKPRHGIVPNVTLVQELLDYRRLQWLASITPLDRHHALHQIFVERRTFLDVFEEMVSRAGGDIRPFLQAVRSYEDGRLPVLFKTGQKPWPQPKETEHAEAKADS